MMDMLVFSYAKTIRACCLLDDDRVMLATDDHVCVFDIGDAVSLCIEKFPKSETMTPISIFGMKE